MSAAVDPAPTRVEWCNAVHPIADRVICRKLRHPRTVLHNSRNVPDWAEPTTPTDQENRNG